MGPGTFGTVSSVSGETLMVASRGFRSASTTTVYTVNAAGAVVVKDGATSTLSAVAQGDHVLIEGTVSGTNITATLIRDGFGPGARAGGNAADRKPPAITGNGEPVIAGSITAVAGTTLTVTTGNGVVYSVAAGNASIVERGATSTLASVSVGDRVVVQGAVNGNAVTASSIIDSGAPPAAPTSTPQAGPGRGGFFGSIFGFFARLFGF